MVATEVKPEKERSETDKKKPAVRVIEFEIVRQKADGGGKYMDGERFKKWEEIGEQCQQAANTAVRTWELWHFKNGSPTKIRETMSAIKQSHADGTHSERKKNGEFAFPDVMPAELRREIYAVMKASAPGVHGRVLTLIQSVVEKKIKSMPSSHGSFSGWCRALIGAQRSISFGDDYQIPFDRANSKILVPKDSGENYRIALRLDAIPGKGASRSSTEDTFEIWSKGRKLAGPRSILDRITKGEPGWKFCGSQLKFDRRKNKWFALICFQGNRHRERADGSGVAALFPGEDFPVSMSDFDTWFIRMVGGPGSHIGFVRKQLDAQRLERSKAYSVASSARKGHGRQRNDAWRGKFKSRLNDMSRSFNHIISSRAIKICLDRGITTLYWIKPDGTWTPFLERIGHDHSEVGSWNWSQLEYMLKYKCEEHSIAFDALSGAGGNDTKKGGAKKAIAHLQQ